MKIFQDNNKEHKFHIIGPFRGDCIGHRWIPIAKAKLVRLGLEDNKNMCYRLSMA